jgi:hypothetical protein
MRILLAPLVLATLLIGCGPSIDPAAKADIDRRVATLTAQGQPFGAPANATPMPMAVGQWVTYKSVNGKGEPSFLTMKLVGQEVGAFWCESVVESYQGKTSSRMLVDFGDRRRPDSIVIKAAKTRDRQGHVTEFPENMIGFMNSMLRGSLGPIVMDWSGLPQEDAAVPAGTFSGCYKGRSEVTFAGFKATSTVWGHNAVPLSGMVRSHGDNNNTMELVAFGTSGAQSEF